MIIMASSSFQNMEYDDLWCYDDIIKIQLDLKLTSGWNWFWQLMAQDGMVQGHWYPQRL